MGEGWEFSLSSCGRSAGHGMLGPAQSIATSEDSEDGVQERDWSWIHTMHGVELFGC